MPGWNPFPGAVLYVSPPNQMWDDPIQGAASDCSCIAGMAALAWVDPPLIQQNLTAAGTQCKLYNPAQTIQQQTSNLWLNANGNLVYAKSYNGTEVWPAFYEKAYAKFVQGITAAGTEPNMGGPWNNLSMTPLNNMTGWAIQGPYSASTANPNLTNFCTPIGANNTAQTTSPGIAWTGGANGHSYSILGLYQDAAGQWVILRDPFRQNAVLPPYGHPAAGSVTFTKGAYNKGVLTGAPTQTVVSLINGTFGMSIANFSTYFASFGFMR